MGYRPIDTNGDNVIDADVDNVLTKSDELVVGDNPAEVITETTSPSGFTFDGSETRDIWVKADVTTSNGSTASATENVTVTLYDGIDNTGVQVVSLTLSVTVAAGGSVTTTFDTVDQSLDTGTYYVEVTTSGTTLAVDQTDVYTKGGQFTFGDTVTGNISLTNQDGDNLLTFDTITGRIAQDLYISGKVTSEINGIVSNFVAKQLDSASEPAKFVVHNPANTQPYTVLTNRDGSYFTLEVNSDENAGFGTRTLLANVDGAGNWEIWNGSFTVKNGGLTANGLTTAQSTGLNAGFKMFNTTGGIDYRWLQKDTGKVALTDETNAIEIYSYDGTTSTFSKSVNVAGTLSQQGNAVWHAGNFDPATKANLAGATFTGNIALGVGVDQVFQFDSSSATVGDYTVELQFIDQSATPDTQFSWLRDAVNNEAFTVRNTSSGLDLLRVDESGPVYIEQGALNVSGGGLTLGGAANLNANDLVDGATVIWDSVLGKVPATSVEQGAGSTLDADTLDTLDSTQFARNDVAETLTGPTTIAGGPIGIKNVGSFSQTLDGTNNKVMQLGGSTSDLIIQVQAGNGRISKAWNAYYDGTNYRNIVASEGVSLIGQNESFATPLGANAGAIVLGRAGGPATAGEIVTFNGVYLDTDDALKSFGTGSIHSERWVDAASGSAYEVYVQATVPTTSAPYIRFEP